MHPTENLTHIMHDIQNIEAIETKESKSEVENLIADIKSHIETIGQYNFNGESTVAREELSEGLENAAEKIDSLFQSRMISAEDKRDIKEGLGKSRLSALGISLDDLPGEIILMIADYLDRDEIEQLIVGLNKSLTEIVHDPRFVASKNSPNRLIIDVLKKFEDPEFAVEQLSDNAKEVMQMATIFDMTNVPLPGDRLSAISKLCPHMEVLKIQNEVTNETLYQVPWSIKHLDISGCANLTVDLFDEADFNVDLRPKFNGLENLVYDGVDDDLKSALDEFETNKAARQKLKEKAQIGITEMTEISHTSESLDIFNFLSIQHALNQLGNLNLED